MERDDPPTGRDLIADTDGAHGWGRRRFWVAPGVPGVSKRPASRSPGLTNSSTGPSPRPGTEGDLRPGGQV
jgi:hypothetical protein